MYSNIPLPSRETVPFSGEGSLSVYLDAGRADHVDGALQLHLQLAHVRQGVPVHQAKQSVNPTKIKKINQLLTEGEQSAILWLTGAFIAQVYM